MPIDAAGLPDFLKKQLGATGEFPKGKIHETDQGELRFIVFNRDRKIILEFGKPVEWMGLDPSDARGLAELLVKHANQIDGPR
jgi:hypothetical protein